MFRKCRAGVSPQCTQLACAIMIRPVLFCRSTWIPRDSRDEYLQSLRTTYTATAYSLFHRNCNDFSNDFSTFLRVWHTSKTTASSAQLSCIVLCGPQSCKINRSDCALLCAVQMCACKTVHCSGHIAMAICCCCLGVKLALYGIHCFDVYHSMSQMTSFRLRLLLLRDTMLHMHVHRHTS